MKFTIITVGKIKENFILNGLVYYLTKINRYTELIIRPIKEERITKGITESLIRQREGERILARVPRDGLWVALERRGREMDSRQHFDFLQTQADRGVKRIYYLIGGPLGLSREVQDQADQLLSLSKMTLPHELTALFLVEQIYRYLNFTAGEKYHK